MTKYDFEYVCQRKSLILKMSKYDFEYWIYLWKEKLTLDISKYDFKYNYERTT
jgi:hypothetical protein